MNDPELLVVGAPVRGAGIDLGSNMFRCVIGERDNSGRIHVLEKRAEVVAVAEGLWENGGLAPEPLARAANAIVRIREMIEVYGVRSSRAVATGAFRKAVNRESAIGRLSAQLGAPIEVIPSAREAELAALGVRSGGESSSEFGVLDVGGVSTEFVREKNASRRSVSVDLGVITLTERGNSVLGNADARQEFFERTARAELAPFREFAAAQRERVHAVGGAAVALIAHRDGKSYCSYVGGDAILNRSELVELFRDFSAADPAARAERLGISRAHGNLIPAGFAILDAAMQILELESVIPSGRGVSEGLLHELLMESRR